MASQVLFVCTGNTCRSPMAEALLRAALPPGADWRVASAGVAASPGARASEYAIEAVAELGVDLSAHRSQPVTGQLVSVSAVIVAMTHQHAQALCERFPDIRGRVRLMRDFDPAAQPQSDVADPFCGSAADYRNCRDVLRRAIPGLLEHLQTSDAQ